jgi:hypothetical protein
MSQKIIEHPPRNIVLDYDEAASYKRWEEMKNLLE